MPTGAGTMSPGVAVACAKVLRVVSVRVSRWSYPQGNAVDRCSCAAEYPSEIRGARVEIILAPTPSLRSSPRLRPDCSAMHAVLKCECGHADAVRAGCSHGVHFAVREACSRSFTWFRRRADQRIVRLSDRLGILSVSLIPRGSQPLNPRSPVPVVLHCVHRTHKARTRGKPEHIPAAVKPRDVV